MANLVAADETLEGSLDSRKNVDAKRRFLIAE